MSITHTRLAVLATVTSAAIVAAAAGCGAKQQTAAFRVVFDTLAASALNGTPPEAPSALDLGSGALVAPNGSLSFDIVFDIDGQGRPLVEPQCLIATSSGLECTPSSGSRRVGMQRSGLPFDSIQFAPTGGYFFDSAFVMAPQQPIIVASQAPACVVSANPSLYGKIVMDSLSMALRTIYLRATIDPNCGYRSFKTGVPTR
jgi:hypothetical protein